MRSRHTERIPIVKKVHACIEILIKCHPAPLRVLLGEIEPPSSLEVADMIKGLMSDDGVGVRSGGVTSPQEQMIGCADTFEKIIRQAGGWEHIVRVTRDYASHFPATWAVFADHLVWVEGIAESRVDKKQMDVLAKKHGVSSTTIWRRRKDVPLAIARTALRKPCKRSAIDKGIDAEPKVRTMVV